MTCLTNIRDADLKSNFEEAADSIGEASKLFEEHATRLDMHTLEPARFQPEDNGLGVPLKITSTDLSTRLYEQKMARIGAPARHIYDHIKLSPKNDLCPLCGVRKVGTLDHYLPRAEFAALAVTPLNLIPACSDCNKFKHDKRPRNEWQQTFNPYVDDVTDSQWLFATAREGAPATVHFSVGEPPGWSNTLIARARHHFNVFKLAELYAHHATTEISSIRRLLRQIFTIQGSAGVRSYLKSCEASAREHDTNSWKAATFSALAASDWYCAGGFDAVAFQ
ncbi:HNH endonuclease [Streptomyces alkaliphilus]|uniref:HNH endonuclease n=1 Tax=Streptomyces alkaliphilus TaxID=1472722 RepID=UPI001180EDC6|nr:HNH endonuclease [Streptomyces alkaliphilus]MQS06105.1 hypothetical protein [Streptomyces alkaliphilus]